MFKDEWFPRYTTVPQDLGKAIFVDSSFGKSQTSDWTVILTAGIDAGGKVYILDVMRLRLQYTELLSVMLDVVEKNHGVPLFVEDAASGQSLIQSLRAAGVPARPLKPLGTKAYRFSSVVPYIENGMVALPQAAPWLNTFLREILANEPLYDDQMDCLAYCCLVMAQYVRQTQGAAVQHGPLFP